MANLKFSNLHHCSSYSTGKNGKSLVFLDPESLQRGQGGWRGMRGGGEVKGSVDTLPLNVRRKIQGCQRFKISKLPEVYLGPYRKYIMSLFCEST